MAEITAKLVNQLRERTGQGMMECKKMLAEAQGDIEKAIDLFRKKGVKASVTARIASEGRVFGARSADGRTAALVQISCNTDFTARSEPVRQVAEKAAQALLANPGADAAALVAADLTHLAQTTGENVTLGRVACLQNPTGSVGLYTYTINHKIGVLLSLSGPVPEDLVTDLGGHIAFARPMALRRDQLPTDLVAKERAIAVEQARATGKPLPIAEKIAEGKLEAFFKERALLDQDFFNAGKFKGSIGQMLKEKGLSLLDYVRVEVGQA
jgi:elongation factor Ts